MPIIPAVVTDDARSYWPRFFGGLQGVPGSSTIINPGPVTVQWDPRIKFFKVGEGGWIDPGSGAVPRTPDSGLRSLNAPFLQDLDTIVDLSRPPISQRYNHNVLDPAYAGATFQKALVPSDITYEAPTTMRVSCLLDFGDFNDDGGGRDPEIWELAIYSDHPLIAGQALMVAYGTFPLQVKNATKQLLNILRVIW